MAVTTSYIRFNETGEFTIPDSSSSNQFPDVLGLSNGGFVVAYTADPGIFPNSRTTLAFYDSAFNLLASELPAHEGSTYVGWSPSIAQLSNGNVLVVWNESGASTGIVGRLFTQTGTPVGAEITLAPGEGKEDPHITVLPDGFAISFSAADGLTGDQDVEFRTFNNAGVFQAGQQVNASSPSMDQHDSAIAELAGGGFVVTYTDEAFPGAIRGAIYNADGSVRKADFLIDDIGNNNQSKIVGLPNGNWAVVYTDSGWQEGGPTGAGITMQIYDANGSNVTPSGFGFIHVNTPGAASESQPDITVLENGFIAVTWTRDALDGTNNNIYSRIFDQNGNPINVAGNGTQEFAVMSDQGDQELSSVSVLPDGQVLTAWENGTTVQANVSQLFRSSVGDGAADTIVGDELVDFMSGGGGFDFASYSTAKSGVTASLGDPASNTGNAEGDTYTSIEGLIGSAFDDTLAGDAGNNTLHGGAGNDTALFTGNLGSYTVQDFGSKVLVSGPDGTDTLTGVEHLQFANATLNVVDDGNPLFDSLYYLSRNPDVFQAGVNPLDHFNAAGRHEGRDPNGFFDTSGYLAVNKDVAAAGVNPLEHYHQSGWHEGRDPSASFDTTLYLINNPDVAAAGIDPLAHYLQFGAAEGRQAHAAVGAVSNGFDAQYYLFHNPDVAAAGIDPLFHFNVVGWQEGRDPNAWFDSDGYLAHYTDVAAAGINPLQHYEAVGWQEGRDPSAGFDTTGYLAAYPDVAAAGMNPLDHFLQFGIYEGRSAINDGVFG
jgi:hypothetical protein